MDQQDELLSALMTVLNGGKPWMVTEKSAQNAKSQFTILKKPSRSEAIELLEAYSLFLEKEGYLDTDWRVEPPYAIDEFLKNFFKK